MASSAGRGSVDLNRFTSQACRGPGLSRPPQLPSCLPAHAIVAGTSPATTPFVVQSGRNPLVMVLGSALWVEIADTYCATGIPIPGIGQPWLSEANVEAYGLF